MSLFYSGTRSYLLSLAIIFLHAAKKRIEDGKSISSASLEKIPSQKSELEHDPDYKRSASSTQIVNPCATEEFSSDLNNGREQTESGDCDVERSGSRKYSNGVSSGDFNGHQREELSSKSARNKLVNGNNGSSSNFRSQSTDSQPSPRGRTSTFTAQRPSDENNPLKTNCSSLNKQLEQSHKLIQHDSDQIGSIDTVVTTEHIDHGIISEELSCTLKNISKSLTTKSSHAYDASVSSYDGWDDQIPDKPLKLSKSASLKLQMAAEPLGTKGRPTREDVLVNNKMSNSSEVQHQMRKFSSMSSGKKHGLAVMGSLSCDKDDLHEPTRYGIQGQEQLNSHNSNGFLPARNRMRLERNGCHQLREPFHRRGSHTVYENGSSSNNGRKEFLRSSSMYSSTQLDYIEQMELLRKVDELRDQLSRSYNLRGKVNGREPGMSRFPSRGFQQDKQRPLYYNYEQLDTEVPQYFDANCPRHCHGPYRPRDTGCQKCGFSQLPFSGQATNCRHHVDYSCSQCYSEDWQCQAQLPPTRMCYNKGPYRGHPSHMCYKPYSSSLASPQQHIDSSFPLHGCNTQSHDQEHMDHDIQKMYYWDRRHPVRRHCRPIAGGAPFIICYNCLKLLQVPVDFLLSQRRFHQLQCGACSEVLKFSLQNRTHITPYNPNSVVPPPTEVDDYSDATSRRNFASESHANDCLQGDPASYSEDYGVSNSTEGDPTSLAPPFPVLQGNRDDRKQHSSSYPKPTIERNSRSVLKQSGNKYKTSKESAELASASSNVTKLEKSSLEAEVAPRPRGSPLHRLMGYSSPSEMINGLDADTHSHNDPEKNLGHGIDE